MQQNDGLLAGIMVQSECHTDLLLPFALAPVRQDTPSVLSGKELGSHSLGDHSSSVTCKHTQVANHTSAPKPPFSVSNLSPVLLGNGILDDNFQLLTAYEHIRRYCFI